MAKCKRPARMAGARGKGIEGAIKAPSTVFASVAKQSIPAAVLDCFAGYAASQ
jgi:hypothetical protein